MSWLARANSRSPVRIATELPHTVCALGTPRRICASSMTSSWYSEREVGDLDRLGGGDHVVGDAGAELRGEQRQHRAHPLAAGLEQVAAS